MNLLPLSALTFSMIGMRAFIANSTSSRLRSSGIWKFGITMHAAMSIPYSGCVATSIAFIPIRSIACSIA
ncbi:TPA: hypothetical protein QDC22_005674 [Burkholderia stabilis]|nr:hypothetical protein [Burkholderia stabilis]HDR9651782.1 hypothetical protein [Burkholderia stabilis]HDR9659773.1 hypothetical protein [Burkholderia stabilis]HDR9682361.1 hypothetical protein [Burkholderia stabilis]